MMKVGDEAWYLAEGFCTVSGPVRSRVSNVVEAVGGAPRMLAVNGRWIDESLVFPDRESLCSYYFGLIRSFMEGDHGDG